MAVTYSGGDRRVGARPRGRSGGVSFSTPQSRVTRERGGSAARGGYGGALPPVRTGGPSGSPGFGGILANLGGDALSVVTGIPSAAALTVRAGSLPFIAAYNRLAAGGDPLTGRGSTARPLGGVEDRIRGEIDTAVNAIGQDLAYRYGPLARGDFGTFGSRVAEHPGFFLLDAASVFSAAGAGVRTGARLTGNARLAERSVLPAGAVGPGGRVSTGARYREPRVREMRLGENTDLGAAGPITARIETPRRPYSANPLTRGIQQRVIEPGSRTFSQFLERKGNEGRILARPFSTQARFNRAAGTRGRDLRYGAELERAARLREESAPFLAAIRPIIKQYKEAGAAAIRLHAQDLLDVPGTAPSAARQAVADFMHAGLDKAVREHGVRSKGAAQTQRSIENIPDELLDLDTAPPALREAVAAARDISSRATDMRVAAGSITPETAAAVGRRPAEQVFGGSRYDPRYVKPTERVQAAQASLEAAVAARRAGPRLTPLRAVRRAFSAGRSAGRGERNVELSIPLRGSRSVPVVAGTPGRAGAPVPAGRSGGMVRLQRGPGITADRSRAYGQEIGGRGRQVRVRLGLQESARQARAVRDARHELAVARREARGGWTPSTRDDVGTRGVYFPDRPVDRPAGRGGGEPSGAFGRMTQDKVHESHGTLFGMGNVSLDPKQLVVALDRALVDEMHPGFIRTMIEAFAFKTEGGRPAIGDRALMAMKADPDNVVLASRKALEDAMRLSKDLPEDQFPEDPFWGATTYSGRDALAQAEATSGAARRDLVAIPRAAVEAVKAGYRDPVRIPLYDTPLQLWRRGILAFAPRWYLNNLFGNTFQFGLLTGGDLKAIRQASMDRVGAAVPPRIAAGTVVAETRLADAAGEVSRLRAGYESASNKGMDFNQRLEGTIRRAAYISRAKRNLRTEGVKIGDLDDAELSKAIESMPPEMVDQTIREVELFMGDYVRMHPLERAVLKRIFPFYSWMRVIGKFMGVVPFRHPKRVALLALVSRASAEAVNPDDYMLPVYDRGRVNLPGGLVIRTSSMNPLATHAEMASNLSGLAGGEPGALSATISGLARDFTPIGGQQAVQLITGRNAFGRPFTAPPGYGGAAQAYGGYLQKINPATGLVEEVMPTPGIGEMLFQTVPLVPSVVRGVASMGRTPYDTASTWDLVTRGKPDHELFRDPANEPGTRPVKLGGVPLNPVMSLTGINIRHRDRDAEVAAYNRMIARQAEAERQTRRRIGRVSGG